MSAPNYAFAGKHRRLSFNGPVPEKKRVYIFPGGDKVEIENVTRTEVSQHGNHMNYHGDTITVVPFGWLALSYPAESNDPPLQVQQDGGAYAERDAAPADSQSPVVDTYRAKALSDVNDERNYQVGKWAGQYDDANWSEDEWHGFITEYAFGLPASRSADYDFRKRMVKVAALAVAAIEACDRIAAGV